MHHAPTVSCDFCQKPINTSEPWTTINAVVAEDVAADINRHVRQQLIRAGRQAPAVTHAYYQVDICPDCERSRLPDLKAMVSARLLIELERAHTRPATPRGQWRDED